eukprot:TRINITY_DN2334_c1_g1_i1.p2 TRINITY_DN2334_c1_g1~~TRINITY_DN2334_c1_g1_i1.p2  ORF type:complete len:190 (-),score=35.98 TRINITY_DN2334_c1_g1_i1:1024-1593(-)
MFKKFSKESALKVTQCKSSVQRAITAHIGSQYAAVLRPDELASIIDKSKPLFTVKVTGTHTQLLAQEGVILFFQEVGGQGDGPWLPTLRLLHRYPFMLRHVVVDVGGCKFVVSGANVMCPGLTSAGAWMPPDNLPVDTPVAVHIEGKGPAAAIGMLTKSTEEIRKVNKDIGVITCHHLGDGLWTQPQLP